MTTTMLVWTAVHSQLGPLHRVHPNSHASQSQRNATHRVSQGQPITGSALSPAPLAHLPARSADERAAMGTPTSRTGKTKRRKNHPGWPGLFTAYECITHALRSYVMAPSLTYDTDGEARLGPWLPCLPLALCLVLPGLVLFFFFCGMVGLP